MTITKMKLMQGYKVTDDPRILDKQNAITPDLIPVLDKCLALAKGGKRSGVHVLLDAIEKHPKNPQLKQYLASLYMILGEKKKLDEINNRMLQEHPNYLFLKLNLANECIKEGQFEKVPELLGKSFDIHDLYPDREVFHSKEVCAFMATAVYYFCGIGNLGQANLRFDVLAEVDPCSKECEEAGEMIESFQNENGLGNYQVKMKLQPKTRKVKPPVFNHFEIEMLYNVGLFISQEDLDVILALPRLTLIQDLETILEDSIARYSHFKKQFDNEWSEESSSFVIHAFFLLGELESEGSLDMVLKVLRQSEDYFIVYVGDFLWSAFWEPIFKIAKNQLDVCLLFMKEPGIDTFPKVLFAEVAVQVTLHYPERYEEVVGWFKTVFHFYLSCKPEDNVLDSDMIALVVNHVAEIQAKELFPEISLLYERQIPSLGICGGIIDVKGAFYQDSVSDNKHQVLSIGKRYHEIVNDWDMYNDDIFHDFHDCDADVFHDIEDVDYTTINNKPLVNAEKVGRNDPCPCGSGKKYKKCCLNE